MLPRRWVVERLPITCAQPLPRRLAKDLGEPQSQGAGILAPHINPPSYCENFVIHLMFPDKLSGFQRPRRLHLTFEVRQKEISIGAEGLVPLMVATAPLPSPVA